MAPEESGQPGTPPQVSILTQGYQYLSELRFDQLEPVVEIIRRDVVALGLPLRSVECEFGPSQCEFTFQALTGLEPADTMVLFRSAVKQNLPPPRPARHLHVSAEDSQRHVVGLAPAPVARRHQERRQRLHAGAPG